MINRGWQHAIICPCILGLATGSSPIATYQKGVIDFSDVKTLNLDEYYGLQ